MDDADSALLNRATQRGAARRIEPRALRELIAAKKAGPALAEARRACAAADGDPAYAYWIGLSLALLQRYAEAEPWLQLAVRADPKDERAHAALGFIGKPLGQGAARVEHYKRALEIAPGNPGLRANVAEALLDAGKAQAAEQQARTGLKAAPGHVPCHAVLARALQAQGRDDEAIRSLQQLLARAQDRELRWTLADVLLRAGRYREGFAAYEVRREPSAIGAHVGPPGLSKPEWQGDALAGRRLLVTHEQGLGDTLQAMRYLRWLHAQGERVAAVVPQPLVRLLGAQPYLAKVYPQTEPIPRNEYDVWCHVMSLPGLLGEDGGHPANAGPYLIGPPATAPANTLRVGLCWAGSAQNPNDTIRSFGAEAYAPLAEVPGVTLISLQHGATDLPPFIRPPSRPIADLADTAALLGEIDLLLSIDSAPVHLAGAMGREVWMITRWFGDWRWGTEGEMSRWYPTLRVLRQPRAGDWTSVVAEVAKRLAARAGGGR